MLGLIALPVVGRVIQSRTGLLVPLGCQPGSAGLDASGRAAEPAGTAPLGLQRAGEAPLSEFIRHQVSLCGFVAVLLLIALWNLRTLRRLSPV